MASKKKSSTKKSNVKAEGISSDRLAALFDSGEDISEFMSEENAVFKVNVDFPIWMVRALDFEANKLQIPRQAVIKNWINDRLKKEAEDRVKGISAVG
ncbi:MAG: CopG family transcriptional regulator [Deltaproteobacteria bacterium]|nr:CopG family transcriptional regulator [Deltaproteobacteria bacterium]